MKYSARGLLLAAVVYVTGCAGPGATECPTSGFRSLNPQEYQLQAAAHVQQKPFGE
jgi:hypothetical protein